MKQEQMKAEYIWDMIQRIRANRPIIHCITNAVTVNDCANVLLAVGASPTMAHHPLEVAEIVEGADALVCNFGAIEDYEAMLTAGQKAAELGKPVVVDPVGVSGSGYRREKCLDFIKNIHPSCIRGNYSEIRALLGNCSTVTGVDAAASDTDKDPEKQRGLLQEMGEFSSEETADTLAENYESLERGILYDWSVRNGSTSLIAKGQSIIPMYLKHVV